MEMTLNAPMQEGWHKDTNELDAIGWGLFFVWSGVALLADLAWGWTLLGVAAIILGGEAYRRLKGLPTKGFWIAIGAICLLFAISDLLALPWRPGPILLIGFGVVLLINSVRRRRAEPEIPASKET